MCGHRSLKWKLSSFLSSTVRCRVCSPCCQDLGHASSKTLTHLTEKCSWQDHHYVRRRREAGEPGGHHHVWTRLWKPLHALWGWAKLQSPHTSRPALSSPWAHTVTFQCSVTRGTLAWAERAPCCLKEPGVMRNVLCFCQHVCVGLFRGWGMGVSFSSL